jgi:putative SOS response-associated peptidase YedK
MRRIQKLPGSIGRLPVSREPNERDVRALIPLSRCSLPDGQGKVHITRRAKRQDGWKQPFIIRRRDGRPFGFAGLWEHWQREAGTIASCAVITTEANAVVRPIHGHMPAILRPEDYAFWLDPAIRDKVTLGEVLVPYPDEDLVAYPVGTLVNAAANDRPECVRPLPVH